MIAPPLRHLRDNDERELDAGAVDDNDEDDTDDELPVVRLLVEFALMDRVDTDVGTVGFDDGASIGAIATASLSDENDGIGRDDAPIVEGEADSAEIEASAVATEPERSDDCNDNDATATVDDGVGDGDGTIITIPAPSINASTTFPPELCKSMLSDDDDEDDDADDGSDDDDDAVLTTATIASPCSIGAACRIAELNKLSKSGGGG